MQQTISVGGKARLAFAAITLLALLMAPLAAVAKFSADLQGQSKNDPTWIGGNLLGWADCDYIPMRVYLTGGPVTAQPIRVYFDHLHGTTPGIEDLSGFTPSANVVITAGPTLNAPLSSGTWYYDLTINLTDKSPGFVEFRGRLAAGAHLNTGSSLHLGGTPSLSTLQIFKPAPASGSPDLAVVKNGPAQTRPGTIITYTLNYTNKATCASDATGVQLSDLLPSSVSYIANSASRPAVQVGSSLFWDLGTLAKGASGSVTFKAQVNSNTASGLIFTNLAQILSAETDANLADNVSTLITTVAFNHAPVANDDSYSMNEDTGLIVIAPGVLANDTDADGDRLTALLASGPSHGTLTLNPDGSLRYVCAPGFNGTDTFTYRASDGQAQSGIATVTIRVNPVNDPPSFTKGPNQLVNQDSGPQTVTNWATHISAGAPDEAGQTLTFILTNDTIALFSVQPAITPDGTLSYTPAPHAYGVAHVTAVLKDNGGTANGGMDTSAPQSFTITVNAFPIVNIVEPTNNTVFIAPASITVIADAHDPDGMISQVQILQSTNRLFQTNASPAITIWTNVPAGNYQFTARATDNVGASAISSPVNVTVLDRAPMLIIQPPHFNPQTGLFEEMVRVLNPTPKSLSGVRVMISDLATGMQVFNASGQAGGVSYVQSQLPIPPGGSIDLTIEYYVPNYATPNPSLAAAVSQPSLQAASVSDTMVPVTRQLRLDNGDFLLEFNSESGRVYFVQYSNDMKDWKTAWPSVAGTGNRIQWMDNGPPRTETSPVPEPARFYRVVLAP